MTLQMWFCLPKYVTLTSEDHLFQVQFECFFLTGVKIFMLLNSLGIEAALIHMSNVIDALIMGSHYAS